MNGEHTSLDNLGVASTTISGWGRRAGDRLTYTDADHLAYRLAWGE